MDFADKVVIITGAAQGLGYCYAEALLKQGAQVAISDYNAETGQKTAAKFKVEYGDDKVMFVKCNVAIESQMKEMFAAAVERFGRIDIVINNAGIANENKIQEMIAINYFGTITGTHLAIEHMRKDRGGAGGLVVNIGSIVAINVNMCVPVYSGTKAGIMQFTRTTAANKDQPGWGVRFITYCPSFADTPIVGASIPKGALLHFDEEVKIRAKYGVVPPERVAAGLLEFMGDEGRNGDVAVYNKRNGLVVVDMQTAPF